MRMSVRLLVVCALVFASVPFIVPDAFAANGDVFVKGRQYCADTYAGHGDAGLAVDINLVDDLGEPLYAPGPGTVEIISRWDGLPPSTTRTGYGNAVKWHSRDGRETLLLAHLKRFGATGNVRGGVRIGKLGDTGKAFGAHLHIERYVEDVPKKLVLSGHRIVPWMDDDSKPYGRAPPNCNSGVVYTSAGSVRR